MKIRQGFISNSSSSSFIIKKEFLSKKQIKKIKNHIQEVKKMQVKHPNNEVYKFYHNENDAWYINENDDEIEGYTYMDNFDMFRFLHLIGVEEKNIVSNDY